MRFIFVFCSKRMKTIQTIKTTVIFLILFEYYLMLIAFLQQNNATFCKQFLGLFSQFFPVIFSWWVIYSFQLYLPIKGFNFSKILFAKFFLFLHDLMRLLQRIESAYHHWQDLLLLFLFLSNQENLYMFSIYRDALRFRFIPRNL